MLTPWGQMVALHKHSLLLLLSQAVRSGWAAKQDTALSLPPSPHHHIYISAPSFTKKNWAQNQSEASWASASW